MENDWLKVLLLMLGELLQVVIDFFVNLFPV